MTRLILSAVCILALGPALPASAAFDHSAYDRILRRHVDEEGLVDYSGIRGNAAAQLRAYLDSAARADPGGWSRPEQMAFWINIYNAVMIRHILDNPGLQKVSDKFGLFDKPTKIAGGSYSLNDIEHRILRGKTNPKNKQGPIPGLTLEKFDPRVHFALVCAAVDCPRLRSFAYTADNLEKTLAANAERFANSPRHLSITGGRLRVSSLMKWYGEDFQPLGGPAAYLARLTDPAKRPDAGQVDRLLASGWDEADFVYDWTVNDARNFQR